MKIIIDIETIPTQSKGVFSGILEGLEVKAPDMLKPQLIESLSLGSDGKFKTVPELKSMWVERFGEEAKAEQAKEQWLKTALDGTYGEVCSIAFSRENSNIQSLVRTKDMSESDLLKAFWLAIAQETGLSNVDFVAHNKAFDLPFIYHRSVINEVKPTINFDPYSRSHICTMEMWAGFKGRIGLSRLAKALGINEDKTSDGSKVFDMWDNEDYEKLEAYNRQDVALTAKVYDRLTFKGL